MTDAFISNGCRDDSEGLAQQGPEGLADYRADRDDFPRLLYLVHREIRAQKSANQKATRPG